MATTDTGVVEAAAWSTDSWVSSLSFGIVTGGGREESANIEKRSGISGKSVRRGGIYECSCSREVLITYDSLALLNLALRASYPTGALTAFEVRIGGGVEYWEFNNAKIDSLEVEVRYEEAATASFEIQGLTRTRTVAALSAPTLTSENTMEWAFGNVTVGGSNYNCNRARLSINNNVFRYGDCDTKAASAKRLPVGIKEGTQEIELEVEIQTEHNVDLAADTITSNLAAVITLSDGTNSITFTLSNLALDERGWDFTGDDEIAAWSATLLADDNSAALTIA